MIICPNPHPDYPGDWMLVKQSDHDDHCGYIATHWISDQFWQPTDRRRLALAVAMHDVGSAQWEDHPLINAEGIPWSYWTIPPEDHIELHRQGVCVGREVHPYVGMLISMHVVGIHRDRLHIDDAPNRWHMPEHHSPQVEAFVTEQTVLQRQLLAEVEALRGAPFAPEHLMNDFKIFEVIDILSTQFAACGLADRDMRYMPDCDGGRLTLSLSRVGEWEFRVTPFPFAGTCFECPLPARRVRRRVYHDHDEFREAWYHAERVTLPYACVK